MTLLVHIDGWPFRVTAPGAVDVERMSDEETVAVRGEGPIEVVLDEEELGRQRAEVKKVRQEAEEWGRDCRMTWFRQSREEMLRALRGLSPLYPWEQR